MTARAIAGYGPRALTLECVDAAVRSLQALLERMELARQLDRALELRPGIVALEPRMPAVEQRGGQHVIAVGGIVVRQLADMVGDPEDFLDQDEPAAAFAFRLRVINGNVGAVVHCHADHLANKHYPSPVRDRKSTRLNSSH